MLKYLKKHHDKDLARLVILIAVLSVLPALQSCTQPVNAPITTGTEIQRFMELSQDVKELFDFNVYARDTFVLDSGDQTFRVAMVDDKFKLSEGTFPGGSPIVTEMGTAPFARVIREDRYEGAYTQRNGPLSPTDISIYQAQLTRQALFMKLGSNDAPFLGWEFIGFDLGKPMHRVSDFVTIKNFPVRGGFPAILSEREPEAGLPGGLRNFTFLFDTDAVKGGDSIDIRTKVGPMTIFARTNVGFRQILGRHEFSDPANAFHYGYRTPVANPQNQLYHLITFQTGPETTIDSTRYQEIIDTILITPLIPPDTLIVMFSVPDTILIPRADVIDTCAEPDSLVIDTSVFDACFVIEQDGEDTIFRSKLVPDTTITTELFDTLYDSILLPPIQDTIQEDLWVFPYRVIR